MSVEEPRTATISEALDSLRQGRPVLVLDAADREGEGDVVLAASTATEAWIAWTVRHTSGVLCAPLPAARADHLGLPPMVPHNEDPRGTAYTVSVDAREGIGTGISASDRARTLRVLAAADTGAGDLIRPGHVFPLRAAPGGVLERAGHTEAAVDLCRLAGLPPVAAIAELVDDSGPASGPAEVLALGRCAEVPVITIAALIDHLRAHAATSPAGDAPPAVDRPAPRVRREEQTMMPTRFGRLLTTLYRDLHTGAEHFAVTSGSPVNDSLVRVHSECLTGELLGSQRCDCGSQLESALHSIALSGGTIVYLRGHEGRGIGLAKKLAAYRLQDGGLDTVDANLQLGAPADAREYGAAAAILQDLGVTRVRLLTNNPAKVAGLILGGIEVVQRVPHLPEVHDGNRYYLSTKRDRMGHLMA
jgi:3,4-dihydroxy 2-butanone 4-phosphate synthase/GTP cyclohydrolase II